MPFLNPYALYVVIGLLVTNIATFGLWRLAASDASEQKERVVACQAKHEAFVEQVEAKGRIAEANNKLVKLENERIVNETANGWASALDVVRNDAARRVRLAASGSAGSGAMPGISQDSKRNAVPDADPIPAPERVAADCAETTVTANFLQQYIERLEGKP